MLSFHTPFSSISGWEDAVEVYVPGKQVEQHK
jgi:hypothetical protein